LYAAKTDSVQRTLALSLTGLLVFLPAIMLPIMTLNILGQEQSTTVYDGVLRLYDGELYFVAALLLFFGIVIPLAKLLLMFEVSACLFFERYPDTLPYAFRHFHVLDEWGMLEVYMLAIIVSVVKLKNMATVIPDIGLLCFTILILITTLGAASINADEFWTRIENGIRERRTHE